ncbi:MAG: hypothetical protein K2G88_05340, partial [Oscillospiraceae bacterium]|nr:hypothetical protein [Oscillospiraceae bacterium]
ATFNLFKYLLESFNVGENNVKEYDLIEMIVEKDNYSKHGVHKGMRGVVMQNHAIMNKWYVIFSDNETGEDIADILVHENDFKVVNK